MALTFPPPARFDVLARPYQILERLVFGNALEATRFHFIPRLAECRRLLLLGDGDGRALREIAALAPQADIDSLDASGGMLARAAREIPQREHRRIRWIRADALDHVYRENEYDAVVAFFFLDCFTPRELEHLLGRVLPSLRTGGLWLHADFAKPAAGLARRRAEVLLFLMHAFFRAAAGLHARELLDLEGSLHSRGLVALESAQFQSGFLRTSVFQKPGSRC